MNKEYLEALEIECGELVEMDLLFLDRNGENQEKWHNSEAFKKAVEFEKKYGKSHTYILKQALQRLESIENTKPSEALKWLEHTGEQWVESGIYDDVVQYKETQSYREIKQSLIKAQEDEEENKRLWNDITTVSKQYTDLMLEYQEQKRVLEIIKKKEVDIGLLSRSENWLDYYTRFKHRTGKNTEISEEEFDTLKSWLEKS